MNCSKTSINLLLKFAWVILQKNIPNISRTVLPIFHYYHDVGILKSFMYFISFKKNKLLKHYEMNRHRTFHFHFQEPNIINHLGLLFGWNQFMLRTRLILEIELQITI